MSRESAFALTGATPTPSLISGASPPIGGGSTPETDQLEAVNNLESSPELTPPNGDGPAQLKSTPFNQLAKKEAELVRQRQELKKDQEFMVQQKAQALEIQKQWQEYNELKAKNPIEALKKLGFSEADLFNFMAENEKKELSPDEKMTQAAKLAAEEQIKAFRDEQAAQLKKEQEARDEQSIAAFKSDLSKTLEANKEKFEYCAYHGAMAEDLAYETVLAVVKESNGQEIITPEEALELVEQHYEEQDKAMMSIKKRQPKTEPVKEEAPAAPSSPQRTRTVTPGFPGEPPLKPTIHKTRTLSSGATATVASARTSRNESPQDKRARLEEWLKTGVKPG